MSDSFAYPQRPSHVHPPTEFPSGLCSTSSSLSSLSSTSSYEQDLNRRSGYDSGTDEDGGVTPKGISTQIYVRTPSSGPFIIKRTPNTTPILEKGAFLLRHPVSPCPQSWSYAIPTLRISPATTPASSPSPRRRKKSHGGIIGYNSTRRRQDLATLYNALIAITLVCCLLMTIATIVNSHRQPQRKEVSLADIPLHHPAARSTFLEHEQLMATDFELMEDPEVEGIYTDLPVQEIHAQPEGLGDERSRRLGRYACKLGLWRLSDVSDRFGSPPLTSFGRKFQVADIQKDENSAVDSTVASTAIQPRFVIHTPPMWLYRRRRWGRSLTALGDEKGD
ncbi:hypothetical protein FRB97_004131 [Tulasnella sp. 331]|nr:hypothetical protein FRB97_004131 [Tulasnella sp. 331]